MSKYNPKDIHFVGRYDYDKPSPPGKKAWHKTFSVGIFQWELRANGKEMKKGKTKVRIGGKNEKYQLVLEKVDQVIKALDTNTWDGRKNLVV